MEDQVPEDVKNDRVHRLIELSNQLAKEYASAFEGEVLEIIPEEQFKDGDREGLYVGYTDNYLKIVFEGSEELIGKLVKVKITKAGYPYNEAQFVRVLEDDVKKNQQAHKRACNRKWFACFLYLKRLRTRRWGGVSCIPV